MELRSLTESIDIRTPAGEAYFTILAAMAQMERRLNSERTKAGTAVARRREQPAAGGASVEGGHREAARDQHGHAVPALSRQPAGPASGRGGGRRVKLAAAQEAFLEDLRARALRKSTLDGYLAVFRLWLAKSEAEGRAELEDWDAAALRA